MKSMTGYGSGTSYHGNLEIFTEITSVNRRNLEINVFLPRPWLPLEHTVTELTRSHIGRGKLNIYIKAIDFSSTTGFIFNEEHLSLVINKLKTFSEKQNIAFNPTPELVFSIIQSLDKDIEFELNDSIEAAILQSTEIALNNINLMKVTEGSSLAKDIHERLELLSENIKNIGHQSKNSIIHYKDTLFQRLKQAGLNLDLDDERVLKEIALFADKCDISEELTRLKSHIEQFIKDLESPQPTGRKMDFICQEMNRELNTLGSKTNLIEVSHKIIDCKNELEKIREQVQNIE